MPRLLIPAFLVAALSVFVPAPATAQPPTDLLLPAQASSAASRRDVPARRMRKARVNLPALNSAQIRLHLFDDVQPTVTRKTFERPRADTVVWVGEDESGAQAVLTVARGVLTGTVFADHRSFEITLEPDGQYSVAEIDPTAFPTDDPFYEDLQFEVLEDADGFVGDQVTTGAATSITAAAELTGTPVIIDAMIVWTPRAETAAGGRAAMDSLALNAIANANLVYTNSGVNAQLKLVYAGPVTFTETASNITGDLAALRSTSDGKMDTVHSLRTQYGADIVTLLGDGYKAAGYCGYGYIMSTVSTSFASYAFNVVDRACAVSNLSYAHEVGHNQGLHHDPSNASGATSYPYAYGYQDPSGLFRTLLSYGSARRVPYLSSPTAYYSGLPTGTSGQDNARALRANVGTIAAFRSTSGGTTGSPTTVAPTCSYSVSSTSLSFASGGGSKSLSVSAPSGCTWSVANTTSAAWIGLSRASGTGSLSVTVTVSANSSSARSATITVAGKTVGISQSGVKTKGKGARDRTN